MRYQIRKAQKSDLNSAMAIYMQAQQFMEKHNNPDQWGRTYPSAELICQDIDQEKLFVIWNESGIHGVFYYCTGPDPTYNVIYEGQWNLEKAYGVIHRIAGDGSGGILRAAVDFARKQTDYLRIDTHADNYVMQSALDKLGFIKCGIIHVEDGSARIAYDRMESNT